MTSLLLSAICLVVPISGSVQGGKLLGSTARPAATASEEHPQAAALKKARTSAKTDAAAVPPAPPKRAEPRASNPKLCRAPYLFM